MKFLKNDSSPWQDKGDYSKKVFLTAADLGHPGAQIQELKIKPGAVCADHYHKIQTEIFYFTKTNGWFEVNGKKINLAPGDVLVIEPNDRHRAGNESDTDFVYIGFKLNYPGSGDFYNS